LIICNRRSVVQCSWFLSEILKRQLAAQFTLGTDYSADCWEFVTAAQSFGALNLWQNFSRWVDFWKRSTCQTVRPHFCRMNSLVEWILSWNGFSRRMNSLKSALYRYRMIQIESTKNLKFFRGQIWRFMDSAPTIHWIGNDLYESFHSVIFIIAFPSFHSVHHFILWLSNHHSVSLLFPNQSFHSLIFKSSCGTHSSFHSVIFKSSVYYFQIIHFILLFSNHPVVHIHSSLHFSLYRVSIYLSLSST